MKETEAAPAHPPQFPRALVIGRPVAHARSPLIHTFWLESLGIDGIYDRALVMPGAVAAFLRELPSRGYVGGNVTVPHKEEAFAACDRTTAAAQGARAVNTFWFEQGALVGDNTDGIGFMAHLDETHPGWAAESRRVLVFGAGGAARGILPQLLARGIADVTVANRSAARAEALVTELGAGHPNLGVTALAAAMQPDDGVDLVINTTSLGMSGQPPLEIDLSGLGPHAIVADLVYVPLQTPLLAAATARGLRTLDGLGMLLHQAVPGFARWFGVRPTVTAELRQRIIADLAANAG